MKKLSRSFYNRDTVTVARELLGMYLVHKVAGIEKIGRIVEVEAYLGEHDLASHSSKGVTPRNKVMFGPPGYAYIYLIYGMHYCMNIVTEAKGRGAAVLLRALEPIQHLEGRTQGPGLLTRAMAIDKSLNAVDLTGDSLFVAKPADISTQRIIARPRIGVAYAGEWADKLLRFYLEGNAFISKK